MTSKEQVLSRLNMSPVGRTPVFPRDLTLGLDALDIPTTQLFQRGYDYELSAKAVLALQKITNHDAVVGCIHSVGFDVEPFGGAMMYPSCGIPYVQKHPFSSPDGLYSADKNSVD